MDEDSHLEPYIDICFDCKYFINEESGSVRKHYWYNHFCQAHQELIPDVNSGTEINMINMNCKYAFPICSFNPAKKELEPIRSRFEILDIR
jgi:hypothetical protein